MAAEQGLADAQYEMGWAYLTGDGVEEDLAESIRWTELAANQGHVEAQYDMGGIFDTGDGVVADREEALRWYGLAAAQGHEAATTRLAEMTGAETPVDRAVVGLWEIYIPNGQNWWRWTLDVAADGSYVFEQDGVFGHSGTIEARDGAWQLASQTNGWTDGGTYQMPNGNTFNMTGKLGPGSWRRATP
jgi:hypothetical protein